MVRASSTSSLDSSSTISPTRRSRFEPLLPGDHAPPRSRCRRCRLLVEGFLGGVGTTARTRAGTWPKARHSGRPSAIAETSGAGSSETEAAGEGQPDFALAETTNRTHQRADRFRGASLRAGCRRARRRLRHAGHRTGECQGFARRRKHLMEIRLEASGIADPRGKCRSASQPRYSVSSIARTATSTISRALVSPGRAVLVPGRPQGEFLLFRRERAPPRAVGGRSRGRGPAVPWPRTAPTMRSRFRSWGTTSCPVPVLEPAIASLTDPIGGNEFDQKLLAMIQTAELEAPAAMRRASRGRSITCCTRCGLFKSRGPRAVRCARRRASRPRAQPRRNARVPPDMRGASELEAKCVHEFRRDGAECSYPAPSVAVGQPTPASCMPTQSNDVVPSTGSLVLHL